MTTTPLRKNFDLTALVESSITLLRGDARPSLTLTAARSHIVFEDLARPGRSVTTVPPRTARIHRAQGHRAGAGEGRHGEQAKIEHRAERRSCRRANTQMASVPISAGTAVPNQLWPLTRSLIT